MEYSEYEGMVNLIKAQEAAINEFKKDSRVVLVDERSYHYNSICGPIPRIIADEALAKEYLQKEFDQLARHLYETKESLLKFQKQQIELKKQRPPKWYHF
jgi:hypothetical protein